MLKSGETSKAQNSEVPRSLDLQNVSYHWTVILDTLQKKIPVVSWSAGSLVGWLVNILFIDIYSKRAKDSTAHPSRTYIDRSTSLVEV